MENLESNIEMQSSDMELAMFLCRHIEASCEDLAGNNIRDFYIREAKRVMETMSNLEAKELLQEAIDKYAS